MTLQIVSTSKVSFRFNSITEKHTVGLYLFQLTKDIMIGENE